MSKQVMREHMKERFGNAKEYSLNPPLPTSLNVELNSQCNHKCVFCGFHGKYTAKEHRYGTMSYEDAIKILDEAWRLGIGSKELGLYLSGEVFLYKDLAKVISYAKQKGFPYVFVTSNGTLATPNKMKEVLDAGLDSIRFSINASDRETYKEIHGKDEFDTILDNIKFMRKYIDDNVLNVATSISCVITKKSLHIRKDMKKIFGEYVDDIMFIPVSLTGLKCDKTYFEENVIIDDSVLPIMTDYVCPILFNTMYINSFMEVIPCCRGYIPDEPIFDLKKEFDIEKAWSSDNYRKYREIFIDQASDKGTICEECILRKGDVQRLQGAIFDKYDADNL